MSEPTPDITSLIGCVRREIGNRERSYPYQVRSGRLSQVNADHELRCMRAVLAILEQVKDDTSHE